MHPDEELLQRLMHGESTGIAERSLREHVAACPECRERLLEARRDEEEVHALLGLVDHPPPAVRAESVVAMARRAGDNASGRWAAGVLLLLTAAGAAYAAPGSPVREWARSAVEWTRGGPESAPPAAEAREAPELAGLAISPGRSLTILFESVQPDARVRVSLGEWAEVRVRAPIGAATFTSDAERLVIANGGPPATYEIEIPRDAPRVEIQVAGERIFLKDGARIVAAGAGGAQEPYLLHLSSPTGE
jgi:hypothetical protein